MHKKLYTKKPKIQNNQCPSCGFHVSHSATFESLLSGQFDNARDGSYIATRTTPVRASTIEADVLVPAAQSAIWSVAVALPAVSVSAWLRYEWYFPLVLASISMLVSWFSAMKRSESSQNKVEEFQYEGNTSNAQGEALAASAGKVEMTLIDRSEKNSETWKIIDLPASVTVEKFNEFCQGVALGKSIARKAWTPERLHFSRDQYDGVIAKFEDGGLVASLPGRGKTLTRTGKCAIKAYVRELEKRA